MVNKFAFATFVPACFLLIVAAGCSLHRTSNGIAVRSDWSFEVRRAPLLAFRSGPANVSNQDEQALATDSTEKDPELLPWRNRLRNYRFGARIFRDRASLATQHTPNHEELTSMPPAPPATETDGSALTVQASSLGVLAPDQVGGQPEASRPDLVVD